MTTPAVQGRDIRWVAGDRLILDGVTLDVAAGSTVGLLGPNGSGKSTLLRVLAGLRRPSTGRVLLDGRDIGELSRRALGQRLAVVEQQASTELDLTVLDVVRLGRTAHQRVWTGETADDRRAVDEAIARTGLTDRVRQRWATLSGGERQRVHIARALAQEPSELLLDEPTNHLDIQHQLELLALVVELPVTSIVALHDLNLAAMYCDRIVVLAEGRVVAAGTPAQVLTAELIERVYRVRAVVCLDGPGGSPYIRFLPGRSLGRAAPEQLTPERKTLP